MYEEDGEEIDVLVNKRDERRRLERQNELQRQEQKENGTGNRNLECFGCCLLCFFFICLCRINW
jgi:hypothetical protein